MNQPPGLFGDGGDESRVIVPERADRDARVQIQVLLAVGVPEPTALTAREHERRLAIGAKKGFLGGFEQLGGGGHVPGIPPRTGGGTVGEDISRLTGLGRSRLHGS